MTEEWLPVVGWEGLYEVSETGRVRSLDRVVNSRWGKTRVVPGRELSPYMDVDRYPVFTLAIRGKRKNRKASRLVAEAFIPNPDGFRNVLHNDDVKTNNVVTNLRWGTLAENVADSIRNGTHGRASKTHCRRGHEYTLENTRYRPDRPDSRICRKCETELEEQRRERRKGIDPPRHGSLAGYSSHQCRCAACKEVWSEYQKARRAS